jgi:hypothetical protein
MATASVRALGACLGLSGTFTILGDFFGYASAPPWTLGPSEEQARLPKSLSLLTQVKRLRQPHFNLNLVRVGVNPSDLLLEPREEENVDCAVQLTRDIYAQIGVGIGRVDRWWYIPYGTQYDVIDDDCEANELIDAYDLPDDGIKVFFVTAWYGDGSVGLTDFDQDGSVVLLRSHYGDDTYVATARALAHEMGHMFGLDHQNDHPSNLMCQGGHAKKGLGIGDGQMIPDTTHFYDWQAEQVKAGYELQLADRVVRVPSPWMRGPCP